MKMSLFGFLAPVLFSMVLSQQVAAKTEAETFKLRAWFGVTKCITTKEDDGYHISCSAAGPGSDASEIEIGDCETSDDYGTSCSGQWRAEQSIDGINFHGTILVSKRIDKAGKISYSVMSDSISNADIQSLNSHFLALAGSTVTDTSILPGPYIEKQVDGARLSYIPIILVASPASRMPMNMVQMAKTVVMKKVRK